MGSGLGRIFWKNPFSGRSRRAASVRVAAAAVFVASVLTACVRAPDIIVKPPSDNDMIAMFEDRPFEFEWLARQAIVDMERCREEIERTDEYKIFRQARARAAAAATRLDEAEKVLADSRNILAAVNQISVFNSAATAAVKTAEQRKSAAVSEDVDAKIALEEAENALATACDLFIDQSQPENIRPAKFIGPAQIEAYTNLSKSAGLPLLRITGDSASVYISAYRSAAREKGFYYLIPKKKKKKRETIVAPLHPSLDAAPGAVRGAAGAQGFRKIHENWYLRQF